MVVTLRKETSDDYTLNDSVAHDVDTYRDAQIVAHIVNGPDDQTFTYSSSNPSVASVDASGAITHHSHSWDGVTFNVHSSGGLSKAIGGSFYVSQSVVPVSIVPGTFAAHVDDQMQSRIDAEKDVNLFTSMDWASATYTRNPNCWLADIDLTAICVGTEHSWGAFAITLLTPSVGVTCNHAGVGVGNVVRWLDANGDVYTRSIIDVVVPRLVSSGAETDIRLVQLDSPLPASVKPMKLLPTNWRSYRPPLVPWLPGQYYNGLPDLPIGSVFINQDRKAIPFNWSRFIASFVPVFTERVGIPAAYKVPIYDGASGCPGIILVNGEAVYLFEASGAITGGNTYISGGSPCGFLTDADPSPFMSTIIQGMIASDFGLTEELEFIDLTGFNQY